jgi:hypothetical protein
MSARRDRARDASGKALYKSKKLFPITSMKLSQATGHTDSTVSRDADLQAPEVKYEYEKNGGPPIAASPCYH